VLGHVDGVGRVARAERRQGALWLTIELPRRLASQLLPKGSIAVDGVSLTLDEGPFPGRLTVTVIPHTLSATTFGAATAGRLVNLELDVLAKATQRSAAGAAAGAVGTAAAGARPPREPASPLTVGALLERGFGSRLGRR
jgi:riboflavin synthase